LSPPERLIFVLDQNFPRQVANLPWPPELALIRLDEIDSRLASDTEDWEILLELEHLGTIHGFITNDANILLSSREMLALSYSNLRLVATDGVGHDPLKASGLVMVHLSDIARDRPGTAMTYLLRPSGKSTLSPGKRITQIARHQSAPRVETVARDRSAIVERVRSARPHLLPLLRRSE
jgi:hypothetical protein